MTPAATTDKEARRRKENLRACLALRGFQLLELADATFIVSRWNLLSQPLADIAAAEAFANNVGVQTKVAA